MGFDCFLMGLLLEYAQGASVQLFGMRRSRHEISNDKIDKAGNDVMYRVCLALSLRSWTIGI